MSVGCCIFVACLAAGCAHREARDSAGIETTLSLCRQLSSDGRTADLAMDDEARFWLQSARADASQRLWHRSGRRALSARLSRTPDPRDRRCLERAQREAAAGRVESF